MKGTIARALFLDAWHQVVDNRAFRVLALVTLLPVGLTFAVGFRHEHVELLWGWHSFPYASLMPGSGADRGLSELRLAAIHGFQQLVVDHLGGTVGLLFCIAATAFFVPRMMERGAADVLFSRPVSRLALLLSRYVAGLLLVSVLSLVLVLGMFLGLWISSGYRDPGFLWSALTLPYLFAALSAFAIAVATATRSGTAAILLTLLFFPFSGCIHQGWMETDHEIDEHARAEQQPVVRGLLVALEVCHWILPKTTEAPILRERLQRAAELRTLAWSDPDGPLEVRAAPRGFAAAELQGDAGGGALAGWRAGPEERVWIARHPSRDANGRLIRLNRLLLQLQEELAAREALVGPVESGELALREGRAPLLRWKERGPDRTVHRERILAVSGNWIYEIDVALDDAAWSAERRGEWLADFANGISLGGSGAGRTSSARRDQLTGKYGWDAPLRYNLFFSIATTMAFALAMLALAWWKLARVDF